jgi:Protein of unknown function (DUF1566)
MAAQHRLFFQARPGGRKFNAMNPFFINEMKNMKHTTPWAYTLRQAAFWLAVALGSAAWAQQTCHPNIAKTRPDSRYEAVAGATPAGSEVRDKVTGLVWQRCVQGMAWSGSTCTGMANTHTWVQALDLARTATASTAAADTAWRLPNHAELFSLAERACYGPAINATWFPGTPTSNSWTWSSSTTGNSDYAWHVKFDYSDSGYGFNSGDGRVRLVRSGQ